MNDNAWSPIPLAICEACGFLWIVILVIGTTYLVGWQGWSGWSYVGAFLLMTCWGCKTLRSPAQIAADAEKTK